MSSKDKIVKSALIGVVALATMNVQAAAPADKNMEQCYGIVKAGLNDCQTSTQSCAGSSKTDRQGDAFLFVPKGTCNKIVGGSLKPIKS